LEHLFESGQGKKKGERDRSTLFAAGFGRGCLLSRRKKKKKGGGGEERDNIVTEEKGRKAHAAISDNSRERLEKESAQHDAQTRWLGGKSLLGKEGKGDLSSALD